MATDLRSLVGKRIKAYREEKSYSQQDMADKLGTTRANLSNIERGEQLPTLEQLQNLVRISDIPYAFWVDGKKSDALATQPTVIHIDLDSKGNKPIPILDIQAAAGYPYNIDKPAYLQHCPVITMSWTQFKQGDYLMIQIKGDSMQNTLYHGDWVICRRLANPKTDIRDGYIHVVVTLDGVVCKRVINRLEKSEALVMQSDNPEYTTYQEKAENILQVWSVEFKMSAILRNENTDVLKRLNNVEAELQEIKTKLKK